MTLCSIALCSRCGNDQWSVEVTKAFCFTCYACLDLAAYYPEAAYDSREFRLQATIDRQKGRLLLPAEAR